jgi:hypothetical protein
MQSHISKTEFLERKIKLQNAFLKSSFRQGTSLFRLGLVPVSVSDHLPVEITTELHGTTHAMFSWNMLSDEHLFNNFMNISGLKIIHDKMNQLLEKGNIYTIKSMEYHFFAELAQFLYTRKNTSEKIITIDEVLLKEFCNLESQGTRLFGRAISDEQKEQIQLARNAFLALYKSDDFEISHEVKESIHHSLEMIYHIKDGSLLWENRLKELKNNAALMSTLLSKRILMFQEVTNPNDLLSLFSQTPQSMTVISHNSHPEDDSNPDRKSKDNCVLMFDTNRYQLIEPPPPFKGDIHKKPYLFLVLKDKNTEKSFIVSSIHHPGGHIDYRQEYLNVVQEIREAHHDLSMPYIIAGDYNHTQAQFKALEEEDASITSPMMIYPMTGSMAANDYGNLNQAIDAVMTDCPTDYIEVKTAEGVAISRPSNPVPYSIRFVTKNNPQCVTTHYRRAVESSPREIQPNATLELNDSIRQRPIDITRLKV